MLVPLVLLLLSLDASWASQGQDPGPGSSPCKAYWTFIGVKTDCTRGQLTTLPSGLEATVHYLDMSYNNVTSLPNGTFSDAGLMQLEQLHMDNNGIASVNVDAFRDLKVLRTVRLAGNKIRVLHPDTFQHNPQLQDLNLSKNPLMLPASGPFLRAPLLLVLNLQGCGLQTLPDKALEATPSLRLLILSHNHLGAIGNSPFTSAAELVFLNLSENKLSLLGDAALDGLRGLLRLDMQNNALASLRVDVFAPLTALKRLELLGNPLNCNCQLRELWLWTVDRNLSAKAMCSGGVLWTQLQDLQC